MKQPESFLKAFFRGFAAISPNCKEAVRLQSQALDHRLPGMERLGLRLHLVLCMWCRRYGKQIRLLRDAAHEHPEELAEAVPQKLSAAAKERISQSLRKQASSEPPA
jgi:hypothetical protein